MTTVFAYHRVADYDFWRAGYARAIAATPEVQSYRIWRGQDDPNYVITVLLRVCGQRCSNGALAK